MWKTRQRERCESEKTRFGLPKEKCIELKKRKMKMRERRRQKQKVGDECKTKETKRKG